MIHLACASNAGYLPHVAALMESLAASNTPAGLRLYLLHDHSVTADLQQRLRDTATRLGLGLELIMPPPALLSELPPSNAFYPSLIWYRILLPQLLGSLDRVLYLDADTIVLQDLQPLWRTDLGDALLGAVPQHRQMLGGEHLQQHGISPSDGYFNSGVLLMDLCRMRGSGFVSRIIEAGRQLRGAVSYPDQDAYNIACANRWHRLHPRWNAFASLFLTGGVSDYIDDAPAYAEAVASPAILHFEGSIFAKPWNYRCVHPHRELYRAYRKRSAWPLQLEGTDLKSRLLGLLPVNQQLALGQLRRVLHGSRGLNPRDGPKRRHGP